MKKKEANGSKTLEQFEQVLFDAIMTPDKKLNDAALASLKSVIKGLVKEYVFT